VIHTDNRNTVDIFTSLRALPDYNSILRTSVDLLYAGNHDLRVLHIPGVQNEVADALSRRDYTRAWCLRPDLEISEFEAYRRVKVGNCFTLLPPRQTLGVPLA
jgi:hypothetical protein